MVDFEAPNGLACILSHPLVYCSTFSIKLQFIRPKAVGDVVLFE